MFNLTLDDMNSVIGEPMIDFPCFDAVADKTSAAMLQARDDSDFTTCGTGTTTPSDFSDCDFSFPPFYFSGDQTADLLYPIGVPAMGSAPYFPESSAGCEIANSGGSRLFMDGLLASQGPSFQSQPLDNILFDPALDASSLATLQELLSKILMPVPVPISANKCAEPRSVFVGNIPPGVSLFVLQKTLGVYGPLNFCFFSSLRVELEDFPTSTGDGWKCAFATFCHSSGAKVCTQALNNKRVFSGHAHHKLVCCAAPQTPKSIASLALINCQSPRFSFQPLYDDATRVEDSKVSTGFSLLRDGPAGSNLFVYGLPSDWTEVPLLEICQEFGHVVGVRVPMSDCDGRSQERSNRGFGFVSYDCCESAFKALSKLATSTLLSKQLKVQLKSGEGHLCPHELSHFVQKSRRSGASASNLWSSSDQQPTCRNLAGKDRQPPNSKTSSGRHK